jgi:hypothetical protein
MGNGQWVIEEGEREKGEEFFPHAQCPMPHAPCPLPEFEITYAWVFGEWQC